MLTLILIILFSCRIYYNPSPLFEEYKNYRNQKKRIKSSEQFLFLPHGKKENRKNRIRKRKNP